MVNESFLPIGVAVVILQRKYDEAVSASRSRLRNRLGFATTCSVCARQCAMATRWSLGLLVATSKRQMEYSYRSALRAVAGSCTSQGVAAVATAAMLSPQFKGVTMSAL